MLKLGVMVDSHEVPAWVYHSLERVKKSDCAGFALILINTGATRQSSRRALLHKDGKPCIYGLYNTIDEKLFCRGPGALHARDLRELLPDVPAIRVGPVQNEDGESFFPAAIEAVRHANLDVLIKFGFSDLHGEILTCAKHGIWTYQHGDHRTVRGDLAGFRELVEGQPETGAALCRLSEDSSCSQILYRSWFFTYPFSAARNREYCLWASTSFLARQIELLSRIGDSRFLSEVARHDELPVTTNSSKAQGPTNLETLKLIGKLLVRNLREILQRTFRPGQWRLLYHLGENPPTLLSRYKNLIPPGGLFWADPHVVQYGDYYYIFIEEYSFRLKKGYISVIEMDQEGNIKAPVPVLETNYHLSYPNVFKWAGKYYMVPESAENRTIDLYECVEFPFRWQHRMTLMENVRAVDTTVFYHSGRWWLFTAMAENEAAFPQVELFIFYSDGLFAGDWRPHARNPVVSDVKRARPAGALFVQDGKIYRPSQDCSKAYGYGFDLNEILVLTEADYCERTATSVRPGAGSGVQATHTFARAGQLTVVDALYSGRRFQ